MPESVTCHQVLASSLGLELVRKPSPAQGVQHEIDLFGRRERVGFYNTFAARSQHDLLQRVGLTGPVQVSRDPRSGEVHALRGPGLSAAGRRLRGEPQRVHPADIAAKLGVLHALGDILAANRAGPVLRIGRMGGQFAKPRSQAVERHEEQEFPAFRGHMVNSELPTITARQHDPGRMLCAYRASAQVHRALRTNRGERAATQRPGGSGGWSSHEALVIDYEGSAIRTDPATGASYLSSTHLPWVGERTRQPQSAHVRLLSSVRNPVGCKLGPTVTAEQALRLCALLDPDRVPGRLAFIVRMGAQRIWDALPPIVEAVRRAGHPVVWMSDPMHGNTVRSSLGLKTRRMPDMIAEAVAFRSILECLGEHPAGLHLEVAVSEVTECVGGAVREEMLPQRYTTLCDPRLNPEQATELLQAWA